MSDGLPSGLFVGDGKHLRTIADTNGTNGNFVNFLDTPWTGSGGPAINNAGQVAFSAHLLDETFDCSVESPPDECTLICGGDPACFPGNVQGIFVASQKGIRRIVDNAGTDNTDNKTKILSFASRVDINDAGDVLYSLRSEDQNGDNDGNPFLRRLNLVKNGRTVTLVNNVGKYSRFGGLNVNNQGQIAFVALLDPASQSGEPGAVYGIFAGPNPATDTVVKSGDTLDEKTVSDASATFATRSLNNRGQIAFGVQFTDGTAAVYRADPRPAKH